MTVTAASADLAAKAADAAVAAFVDVRRDALGAIGRRPAAPTAAARQRSGGPAAPMSKPDGWSSRRTTSCSPRSLELRASLDELEEARREPAEVVRPAVPPGNANHANTEVPMTSGAMVGLLGGCLLGAGRDRARRAATSPPAHELHTVRPTCRMPPSVTRITTMQSENPSTHGRISTSRAVRHHLAVVICFVARVASPGGSTPAPTPTTYTSTARVLVNPSVGNPYVPTPASVRQDELTSLRDRGPGRPLGGGARARSPARARP